MNAFLALVRKDLLQYLANRRAIVMSLVAPVLIAAFFGTLFSGKSGGVSHVPVAIVDLDGSPLSTRVATSLAGDPALEVQVMAEADALAAVRAGRRKAAITLPANFGHDASRSMFGGAAKPEVVLTVDPSNNLVLPLVRGLLSQYAMREVSQSVFGPGSPALADARAEISKAAELPDAVRADLLAMFDGIARVQSRTAGTSAGASPGVGVGASVGASVGAGAGADVAVPGSAAGSSAAPAASAAARPARGGGLSLPFTTREVEAVGAGPGGGYDGYAHSFAGMGVQFILLFGVDIGIALLAMRRMGLWLRLRASPISRAQLLGSRMASCALIAVFVFAVLFAVAIAGFGVRVLGSWAGLILLIAVFAMVTASFGLMIAAIGGTPEATRSLAIVATLMMVMLGGAWVPSFILPPWMQRIAEWVPTHWAVNGFDAMTWRGQAFEAALQPAAIQFGFAVLFGLIALWRFRWEE